MPTGSDAEDGDRVDLKNCIEELQDEISALIFPEHIKIRTDPEFLAKFIRTKDFNIDAAVRSFRKYYGFVNKNLGITRGTRPTQFQNAFNSDAFLFLENEFQGSKIGIFRIKFWKPKEVSLTDLHMSIMFLMEQYSTQISIQQNGVYIICDLEGLRFEHLWNFGIREIRRTVEIILDGIPIRMKGIHYVNTPTLFLPIHKIGIRFVKEKIRKRVHLHSNVQSLHEWLGKEILPFSLGGELEDSKASDTNVVNQLLQNDAPYETYWRFEPVQDQV